MTTTYQTTKHLFEPLPNDSVTCRWCERSFSNDLHSNVPTQPALEGGEWQVVHDGLSRPMIETSDGRLLSLSQFESGRWISYEREEADCAQIVAEHNAVPKLVEALKEAMKVVSDRAAGGRMLTTVEQASDIWGRCAKAIFDSRATTTQPDAGRDGDACTGRV